MEPIASESMQRGGDRDPDGAFAALRRFARSKADVERCELCSTELNADHPHLLNHVSRQITCSCDACAILFCGQEGATFLRVPKRILKLENFHFTEMEWDAMTLPINMVFFLRDTQDRTTATYPSPAGVMESMLAFPAWLELFAGNGSLASVQPEVEAFLVNRIDGLESHYVVPIDAAYRLVGLIRTKWRGLSGGSEAWKAIAQFFASLEAKATRVGNGSHA
jgi:hypothetical protein